MWDEGGGDPGDTDILERALDRVRHVSSNHSSAIHGLCDLGQVISPVWDSLFLWALKVFKDQRHPEVSSDDLRWEKEPKNYVPHSVLNKHFTATLSFRAHDSPERGHYFCRWEENTCEEVQWPAQGHTAGKYRNRDLNQSPFRCEIYFVPTALTHLHGDSHTGRSGQDFLYHPPPSASSFADATESSGGKSGDHFHYFCSNHNL